MLLFVPELLLILKVFRRSNILSGYKLNQNILRQKKCKFFTVGVTYYDLFSWILGKIVVKPLPLFTSQICGFLHVVLREQSHSSIVNRERRYFKWKFYFCLGYFEHDWLKISKSFLGSSLEIDSRTF